MARETYIWDRDLQKVVPKDEYRSRDRSRLQIVRDIDPYRAAAADRTSGKRPVIGGRRQHKEFLRRNGYVELGSEPLRNRTPGDSTQRGDIARDIKRAMGE